MTDTKKLRELAMQATRGPWRWWTSNSFRRLSSDATGKDGDVLHAVVYRDGQPGVEGSERDMGFIAAANPQTVLDLLDRLEKAEAVCEAIDGRHPLAVGDRVGAALANWRRVREGK